MRTSAWIRLIVWSVALVALVGVFAAALINPALFPGELFRFGAGRVDYADSELYTVGGGSVQTRGITQIEINWPAGSVRVEAAEGREITMEEQGRRAGARQDALSAARRPSSPSSTARRADSASGAQAEKSSSSGCRRRLSPSGWTSLRSTRVRRM